MSVERNPSRRQFIKTFVLLTASSTLFGRNWTNTVLAQASPDGGVLRLKLSDYPALSNDYGSVRIGTSPIDGTDFPVGLYYPVIINRGPGPVYYALNAQCTHAGCTVPTFDATAKYIQCPCHGSRYAIDGKVVRNPATFPLTSYATRFDGVDTLTVEIPENDTAFDLTTQGVLAGGAQRFSLRFLAFQNINYEVWFRPSLSDAGSIISFSLTPDGPSDQTVFAGNSDFVTAYVERMNPAGFYSVAMQTMEV